MLMPETGLTSIDPICSTGESSENKTDEHKVVVHLRSGSIVKGIMAIPGGVEPPEFFADAHLLAVEVRLLESKEWMRIPVQEVKAIFLVRSFRGDAKRKALHFYSRGPELGPIWAEVRFDDDEVIEGKIENSARHLLGGGFVLRPTDVGGNNLLVYANKRAVRSYRVLGVRASAARQA